MQFLFNGAPSYWGLAMFLVIVSLCLSAWLAPWQQLRVSASRQHAAGLAILALAIFWLLKVEMRDLFALHPLLMMWVVMVFGAPLAIWIGVLAFLLNSAFGWNFYPGQSVAILFCVVVPVLTAVVVLKIVDCIPLPNLFVYMLGGGFFGAMVTVLAMAALQLAYIWALGPEPLWVIAIDNYYLNLLMMFPEGFINGAIITLLTVLAPDLVKTYDDRRYLG